MAPASTTRPPSSQGQIGADCCVAVLWVTASAAGAGARVVASTGAGVTGAGVTSIGGATGAAATGAGAGAGSARTGAGARTVRVERVSEFVRWCAWRPAEREPPLQVRR